MVPRYLLTVANESESSGIVGNFVVSRIVPLTDISNYYIQNMFRITSKM